MTIVEQYLFSPWCGRTVSSIPIQQGSCHGHSNASSRLGVDALCPVYLYSKEVVMVIAMPLLALVWTHCVQYNYTARKLPWS